MSKEFNYKDINYYSYKRINSDTINILITDMSYFEPNFITGMKLQDVTNKVVGMIVDELYEGKSFRCYDMNGNHIDEKVYLTYDDALFSLIEYNLLSINKSIVEYEENLI